MNSLNFVGQRTDTVSIDVVAEKSELADTKEALAGVDDDPMSGESLENDP